MWVNEGYDEKLTQKYLDILEGILKSEDLAMELRIPAAPRIRQDPILAATHSGFGDMTIRPASGHSGLVTGLP
jgi:hypothetical protein